MGRRMATPLHRCNPAVREPTTKGAPPTPRSCLWAPREVGIEAFRGSWMRRSPVTLPPLPMDDPTPANSSRSASRDQLSELVVRCLERMEKEGSKAIESSSTCARCYLARIASWSIHCSARTRRRRNNRRNQWPRRRSHQRCRFTSGVESPGSPRLCRGFDLRVDVAASPPAEPGADGLSGTPHFSPLAHGGDSARIA